MSVGVGRVFVSGEGSVLDICYSYLRRHILKFVNEKIVNDQHGFMEGKSFFSNLLEAVDSVLEMLEAGYPVDIFTLIFGKLLTQFHITGYLLSWRNTESRAQF